MEYIHTEEGDWLCDNCDFQTNNIVYMKKHLKETSHKSHLLDTTLVEYECSFCDITFDSKSDINTHNKEKHRTFRPCRNFITNSCEYDGDCFFLHYKFEEGKQICFQCGQTFVGKYELINHIKHTH